MMNIESRQTIHAGINFIFVPPPDLDKVSVLKFQEHLDEYNIEITHVEYRDQGIVALRQPKMPLQITINNLEPAHTGQFLIVTPNPSRPLDSVEAEAEDIVKVFDLVWPKERRQILSSDVTIRALYNTSSEHAFKEIWETKLGQAPDRLSALGTGLLGGGLRFVLPPSNDGHLTEVRIESFLQDSSKLFIEVQFKWLGPLGANFDPTDRLELVDTYIHDHVEPFIG